MKRLSLILGALICLFVAVIAVQQQEAGAGQASDTPTYASAESASAELPDFNPQPETYSKKCSFNSDCSHGKCKGGKCGACSFNSDCKGWGKCKNGQCGACSFASDCKGFGSCSSGSCTKSPY